MIGQAAVGALLAAGLVADAETPRPDSTPLVLLLQGDVARDGARLRRLRAGEDVRAGDWRARVVLEARGTDVPFSSIEGGRIPVGGPVRLTDAFVAWSPHRAFEVDVGSQRVPFSLSRQVDEADLRLPERPAFIAEGAPDFRAGVSVGSDLGLLQVRAAALLAGATLDRTLVDRDAGAGALFAFRLGAEPIGPMGVAPWRRRTDDPWYPWWRFSAGVSLLYGTVTEPGTFGVGGDAQLQWKRFTATGEYLLLDASTSRRQGAALEPGVFIIPERLELAARAAWSRLAATDTVGGGAGLTVYTNGAHLRWQAAFERQRTDATWSGWALARLTITL